MKQNIILVIFLCVLLTVTLDGCGSNAVGGSEAATGQVIIIPIDIESKLEAGKPGWKEYTVHFMIDNQSDEIIEAVSDKGKVETKEGFTYDVELGVPVTLPPKFRTAGSMSGDKIYSYMFTFRAAEQTNPIRINFPKMGIIDLTSIHKPSLFFPTDLPKDKFKNIGDVIEMPGKMMVNLGMEYDNGKLKIIHNFNNENIGGNNQASFGCKSIFDALGYTRGAETWDDSPIYLGPGKSDTRDAIFDFTYPKEIATKDLLKNAKLICTERVKDEKFDIYDDKIVAIFNLD